MNYTKKNDVSIISGAVEEFSIKMVDTYKKNIKGYTTYTNANFFTPHTDGSKITLPVNHLVCDVDSTSSVLKKYNLMRGKFVGNKYFYNSYVSQGGVPQFCGNALTTFYIENGKPHIEDLTDLRDTMTYAVAGIPIIKDGKDVMWKTYVQPQGWTGGELYATYHIFLGLKPNDDNIYVMDWKSTKGNMITPYPEAYYKFKQMGFDNVIKLDGGGSEIMKYEGKTIHALSENRQINAIIVFKRKNALSGYENNTHKFPTRVLVRLCKGDDVSWMQQQLCKAGFTCDIDGSFGTATYYTLKEYQKARGLQVDGKCGPATRQKLSEE